MQELDRNPIKQAKEWHKAGKTAYQAECILRDNGYPPASDYGTRCLEHMLVLRSPGPRKPRKPQGKALVWTMGNPPRSNSGKLAKREE